MSASLVGSEMCIRDRTDTEFRDNFNAALAKVLANPAKMLERAGKYGYDSAQLPPPEMTTEWACSTK